MSSKVIDIDGVSKNFGLKEVLKNVSFGVREGTIHGYLGHNAAGKTTTIRITLGLLKADRGRITVFGEDINEKPETKAQIGYVSESLGLYPSATVKENLTRFYELYDVTNVPEMVKHFIEEFELGEFAGMQVKELSAGTKQRVGIARALGVSPKLLVLDEPMRDLDPIQRLRLKQRLKELRRMRATTLIATHVLADAEEICDCITIIKEGRILFTGTIEELYGKLPFGGSLYLRVVTNDNEKACSALSEEYPLTRSDAGALLIRIKEKSEVPKVARALGDLDIYELKLLQPDLETIYANLHGEELRK